MRGLLLVAALAAAACGDARGPAVIPRRHVSLETVLSAFPGGLEYAPEDRPLAWTPAGEVIVAHTERYSRHDMESRECAGTGFYAVSAAAGGKPRELMVGGDACRAVSEGGMAAEPGGRWIVFARYAQPRTPLARYDLATGRTHRLPGACVENGHPAVSADGRWIASDAACGPGGEEAGLYLSRVDGSGARRIAAGREERMESPSWSPDGRRLAFTRVTGGAGGPFVSEVAVTDTGGRGMRTLARGYAPAWSPDGAWIAFVEEDGGGRVGRSTVRLVRPGGGAERVLFRNTAAGTHPHGRSRLPEGAPNGPLVWSPDSRQLLFTRGFTGGTSIWRIDLSTGAVFPVTAPDA